jgi:hydrogenase assembly chaperone HypC/HupF
MCVTAPARVIAVDPDGATVLLGGRERRASTLVRPDTAVGDWVLVGAGTILERLSDEEAERQLLAVREAYRQEA